LFQRERYQSGETRQPEWRYCYRSRY
jgi:hypothetical protein